MVLYGSGDATFSSIMKMNLVACVMWKFLLKVAVNVDRRYHETNSDFTREQMRQYMTESSCKNVTGSV